MGRTDVRHASGTDHCDRWQIVERIGLGHTRNTPHSYGIGLCGRVWIDLGAAYLPGEVERNHSDQGITADAEVGGLGRDD